MQPGEKMRLRAFFASTLLLITVATLISPVLAQGQATSSGLPGQDRDVGQLLPKHAVITARLKVNFGDGIKPDAEAITFTLPPVYAVSYNAGLRILGRRRTSGWRVLYEETPDVEPGQDELILKKVKARSGSEALVVAYYHSGAGTTTDWKIVAAHGGKLRSIESRQIRDKVLRQRKSTFGGYNGVRVEGDIVAERIPMYSNHTARCCPDRPPIEMRVRFTGTALKLDSVIDLPDK